MVQIIAGKKGKGKTKFLLEKANQAVKETNGTIVYIDKSTKHMYELNNKIHDDEDVSKIADSIQKVGMRDPVEVDDKMIILS